MSQCQCITLSGNPCKRKPKEGSRFCYQHADKCSTGIALEKQSPPVVEDLVPAEILQGMILYARQHDYKDDQEETKTENFRNVMKKAIRNYVTSEAGSQTLIADFGWEDFEDIKNDIYAGFLLLIDNPELQNLQEDEDEDEDIYESEEDDEEIVVDDSSDEEQVPIQSSSDEEQQSDDEEDEED